MKTEWKEEQLKNVFLAIYIINDQQKGIFNVIDLSKFPVFHFRVYAKNERQILSSQDWKSKKPGMIEVAE